MHFTLGNSRWPVAWLLAAMTALGAQAQTAAATTHAFEPVTVQHQLGKTVISKPPQRVAALDMNEVDYLDQLGVPVIGMPKDLIPHFLAKYQNAPRVQDLGSIFQPNVEKVHAARPDLILITSLQAGQYKELSQIAPTIQFDVDYRNSATRHIEVIKEHLLTLGRLFGKDDLARAKAVELDPKVTRTATASVQGKTATAWPSCRASWAWNGMCRALQA